MAYGVQIKGPEAIRAYQGAALVSGRVKITAGDWDYLCWYGAIHRRQAEVRDFCDRAITLQPEKKLFLETRGVVRALDGDLHGAIKDLSQLLGRHIGLLVPSSRLGARRGTSNNAKITRDPVPDICRVRSCWPPCRALLSPPILKSDLDFDRIPRPRLQCRSKAGQSHLFVNGKGRGALLINRGITETGVSLSEQY
jgi:hypothetical protein